MGQPFVAPLQIQAGFDTQADAQFNSATAINMYYVYDKFGKNEGWRLRRNRGIKAQFTLPQSGYRGEFVIENETTKLSYFVVGNTFYQMTTSQVTTVLGTLSTSTGFVKIISNQLEPFPQILVVDGTDGWIWNGTTFTQVTDGNFPANPVDAEYMDGRFIVLNGQSNKWAISKINDGVNWEAFSGTEITTEPSDTLVGVAVLNRRIWFFGFKEIEMWQSAQTSALGTGNLPFRRNNNVGLDYGCAAIGSIAKGFRRIFFLARTQSGVGAIMRITGDVPEPVSDEAFEYQLHQYTNIEDFRGYITRTDDGHVQYVLSSTSNNVSWTYDDETGKTTKKEMLNGDRHVGDIHFFFNNKHYLGAYNSGILYEENDDFSDNNGEAIRYLVRTPLLTDQAHKKIRLDRLEIDVIRGVGIVGDPSYERPYATLRISRNAGVTFGNKIPAYLTATGDYLTRTIWRQLGGGLGSRDIAIEIECVTKTDFGIFGGILYGYVGDA